MVKCLGERMNQSMSGSKKDRTSFFFDQRPIFTNDPPSGVSIPFCRHRNQILSLLFVHLMLCFMSF